MDLRFTPEEIAFRDDLRRFFRTEIPEHIRRKVGEGGTCRARTSSPPNAS
ncbi:hypothetical protein ACFQU7_29005 [Pseudoroseomonas wenyumeiae]